MRGRDPETWLPVPGYEGLYEVSDHGQIRSLDRPSISNLSGMTRGRILRGYVDRDGYRIVSLCDAQSVKRKARVHRAVLLAFVGPAPVGMITRHLNGNPGDNRLKNLAYGTHYENHQDRIRHGNVPHRNKTHCKQGHEFTPENTYIRPKTDGYRACRECARLRNRRRREVEKTSRRAA